MVRAGRASSGTATVTSTSLLAPGSRRSIRSGWHVTAAAGSVPPECVANPGHHGRRPDAVEAVVLCSQRRALARPPGATWGSSRSSCRALDGCHQRVVSKRRRLASLNWPMRDR